MLMGLDSVEIGYTMYIRCTQFYTYIFKQADIYMYLYTPFAQQGFGQSAVV